MGLTGKNYDVKVKFRLNVLSNEFIDPSDKANVTGTQGGQRKTILDIPELVITADEYETRIEQAEKVLKYGYWVDPDDVPPIVETDDATDITAEGATLNGHVKSNGVGVHADCGFEIGTDRTLGSAVVATESPVADANKLPISYVWSGLSADTRYYYRAFATDTNFSGGKYGVVKSFKTLPGPV